MLRHAVPLAPLYLLGGNTVSYLLLTALDLALGLVAIAALAPDRRISVGTMAILAATHALSTQARRSSSSVAMTEGSLARSHAANAAQ
jgi:hypothetical protein